MECVPCKKIGLSIAAHYQPGGGKPAQCYYHHFGMPLPKSLQDKIAPGTKPEASQALSLATQRALAAGDKVIESSTPAKIGSDGPASAAPPFRAKHLAKAKNTPRAEMPVRVAVPHADSAPKQDADHSQKKENATMPAITDAIRTCSHPLCKTQITLGNKSGACTKHFHWAKQELLNNKGRTLPPRNGSAAVATICVTESNLDAFWARLSIEEKAEIFSRQLEAGG